MSCNRIENPFNRRHFLTTAGAGFGAVALSALTQEPLLARVSNNPTLPKIPQNWGNKKVCSGNLGILRYQFYQ